MSDSCDMPPMKSHGPGERVRGPNRVYEAKIWIPATIFRAF